MIIVDAYSSIENIEIEFHKPLEELLAKEVPSLEWLGARDRLADAQTLYYIFFGEGQNRPVGLMRLCEKLMTTTAPKGILKLFVKSKNYHWLNVETPGTNTFGLIVDPRYQDEVIDKVKEIISSKTQSSFELIQLNCSRLISIDFPFQAKKIDWSKNNHLVKQSSEFKDYLLGLNTHVKDSYKLEEETLLNKRNYTFIEAGNFKDLFRGSELKNESYMRCLKHPLIGVYKNIKGSFQALYLDDKLISFGVLIEGCKGNSFLDVFFNLDSEINSSFNLYFILGLIKRFYEEGQGKLRFLNSTYHAQNINRIVKDLKFNPENGKTYIIPVLKKRIKKKRPYARPAPRL